ncbi:pantoate--beta-alanine ligase [Erythrobacteraceae bacterium CFH 75059]|uniref:pantoate--beta-alanine ligase n=1 Tax=Qipengyuania thermophila TaxID=2509361 RepID=UPI00101FFDAD|nr:pantoate--beta-alanine ligase [Qipengyuania thermophila]TCD06804.1 pantoate--beta-alanine ligase [Erythrobacteraceae bacterium CFH 75059]
MQTISRLPLLRTALDALRRAGGTIAFVPTMGALHEGHMALVREAARQADHVVASIFVNPTQFGPNEDLAAYPRRMAADQSALAQAGVALLWAPDAAEMYPSGFTTEVRVPSLSTMLCGAHRPGHFAGVATVVCKLFNQVRPDVAVFGEKDWQQLAVIRRMARDLDLAAPAPGRIVGVPTVREADGLALSSRNAYLDPQERLQAAQLPQAMAAAVAALRSGEPESRVLGTLRDALVAAGFAVDYAELRDGDTLETAPVLTPATRLFVAARVGRTRLIDNMAVEGG